MSKIIAPAGAWRIMGADTILHGYMDYYHPDNTPLTEELAIEIEAKLSHDETIEVLDDPDNSESGWVAETYTPHTLYAEIPIELHHVGFGMWQADYNSVDYEWDAAADLLAEIRSSIEYEIYELGKDELPPDIRDIRGNIHNEPSRVFAYIDPDCYGQGMPGTRYFGIDQNR